MPEIITPYPEIVIKMLNGANIKCGSGEKQKILKACPKEKFCSLPTGELCFYGIEDVSQMTQLHALQLFRSMDILIPIMATFIIIFLLGILTGVVMGKKNKK